MQTSESITKVSAAIVAAQAEFGPVAFNAVNPFFKSRYADLGALVEMVRPILERHQLAVIQPVVSIAGEIGITTRIIHSSGEWIESTATLPIDPGKSLAQAAGSTITYLRRYGLAAMLGLYADEDDDANATTRYTPEHQPVSQPARKAPQAQKPQAQTPPVDPVVAALQKSGVIPNDAHPKHIEGFMNLLPFGADDPIDWKIQFGHMYRQARDGGKDTAGAVAQAREEWATWAISNPDAVPANNVPAWVDELLSDANQDGA